MATIPIIEGLRLMSAAAAAAGNDGARADATVIKGRDPRITAAMTWIDSLPDGLREWQTKIDESACLTCLARSSERECGLSESLHRLPTVSARDRHAPAECPLRSGVVLLRAAP